MPEVPEVFREFGLVSSGVTPGSEIVRSYLTSAQIAGQYLCSGLVLSFGLAIGFSSMFELSFPANLIIGPGIIDLWAFGLWFLYRRDYAWVELDGDTLRARHLYTRRVIERSVDEIEDLIAVLPHRGFEIRFQDKRLPLRIQRVDPAMKNATELIASVISRMVQRADLDADLMSYCGDRLIRRIYWKR
jgi:hypothetical protein